MSATRDAANLVLRLRAEGRLEDANIVTAVVMQGREKLARHKKNLDELQAMADEADQRFLNVLSVLKAHAESLREMVRDQVHEQDRGLRELLDKALSEQEAQLARVRKAGDANIKVTEPQAREIWGRSQHKPFKQVAADLGLSERRARDLLAKLKLRPVRGKKR